MSTESNNRRDPEPGQYTARLEAVRYIPEEKTHIWLDWVLTNHPDTLHRWLVSKAYTKRGVGFMSLDLWWWKRRKFSSLGATLDERIKALGGYIGESAHVNVAIVDPEKGALSMITDIWSVGMSWQMLVQLRQRYSG